MTLPCDTRHEVLTVGTTRYEFKHYNDLEPGDQVCLSMAREIEFGKQTFAAEEAYWMGFAVGNGHSGKTGGNHRNCLTITFGDRKGRYTKEKAANRFTEWATTTHALNVRPQIHPNKITLTV